VIATWLGFSYDSFMMKTHWLKLLPFLIALCSCAPADPKAVSCKIALATTQSTDHINQLLAQIWAKEAVTGWTIYPTTGAWRSDASKAFMLEPSVIIEVMGGKGIIQMSSALAHQLEKEFHQEKVLVYCEEMIYHNSVY